MNRLLVLFISLIPIQVFSQNVVKNVKFKFTGAQVVITYDLYATSISAMYDISIEVFNGDMKQIDASMFTGDVGKSVKAGLAKTAYWQTKGDNVNYTGYMNVKVIAKPVITISLSEHMLKTAIYPGWGSYRLNNYKYHAIEGVAAYGSVVSSVLFNQMAYNSYSNYLNATSTSDANAFYAAAGSQQRLSYAFAGTAVAIWGYSLAKTYFGVKKLNRSPVIQQNQSDYYFKQSNAITHAFSGSEFVDIKGVFIPPSLNVKFDDIQLFNQLHAKINLIEASESAQLEFQIQNSGLGDAYNVTVYISEINKIKGIDYLRRVDLGTIKKNQLKDVKIPITTNLDLESGIAKFMVQVKEENGFGLDPIEVNITTKKFLAPNLTIVDYKFSTEKGGMAKKGEKIILQANLQNTGFGNANAVNVKFKYPIGVFAVTDAFFLYNTLNSNQHTTLQFEFLTNNEYKDTIVPITIEVTESWKRYGVSQTYTVRLNQSLSKMVANIYGDASYNTVIRPAMLNSDVNINIPNNSVKFSNKYAVIIGNEDYSSRQPNLTNESNVEYALDDARIFKEYLIRTLGFEEKNVFLLLNATSGEMKQAISRIKEIFKVLPGSDKSEIVFYYAGHGYPDESTKIPYLMPVDVSINNLESAILLSELCNDLGSTNAGKITLFLDACFTGDGRNQGLLAARTARIKPEPLTAKGNMVIFSASTADQTALPYREQQHGMFTYFLLKKLQETKGNVTYGDLYNYVKQNVALESTRTIKRQDPDITISKDVQNNWQYWKLFTD
jgi:hypothetical protein